ncbi:MAG TPA: FHA domain-containing protein, partial [Thermoanaerobaculia bacterium]|nr:FHA domain-containing protein [Thermoanaerobaculia bacterium]
MEDGSRRGPQEFVDIVPGRTTEIYLDVTERRTQSERADQRQPALVMLQGDLPGEVFRLRAGRQLIGRRNDCDIRLREKAVSGHHVEIVRTDAGVSVSDLQSTNGTVVNGRRIRNPVFLAQGNLLKLGNSVFKFIDSLVEVELTESLHTRSTVDPLTGLWNRAHFLTRCAYILDGASVAKPVSMIVIALDDFASVIDSGGRTRAEETLRAVARALRDACDDLGRHFARIGDESFAIVLAETPLASAG